MRRLSSSKAPTIQKSKESIIGQVGVEQYKMAFEQYKLLVDSINKLNETRIFSTGTWMTANGVGISAVAYLRDAAGIAHDHKPLLLGTLILVGIFFTLTWIKYLDTIKEAIEERSQFLVSLEKNFPLPIFSSLFVSSAEKAVTSSFSKLTSKEMLLPYAFLVGYVLSGLLLLFYPEEAISSSK